eukprot:m.341831 g.341831  ORF g.341831 m.341831 type:complete len:558 (-) comp20569_c0_seq1:212-1885(-)
MANLRQKPPQFYVSCDFGTGYSGIAYAVRMKPDDICYVAFHDDGGYCKTPTLLSYVAATGKLKAFGSLAQESFNKKNDFLISNFKMNLHKTNKAPDCPPQYRPAGMSDLDLIVDYLRGITREAISYLANEFGSTFKERDIQWCLTVPAIWEAEAKSEMKQAAIRAGMIHGPGCPMGEGSPHDLIFANEPEAASLYSIRNCNPEIQEGDCILIVDNGAGTTDIIAHKLVDGKVKEIKKGDGEPVGGSSVDKNFLKYLRQRFPNFSKFEEDHPNEIVPLVKEFEKVKKTFGKGRRTDDVLFEPRSMKFCRKVLISDEDSDDDDDDDTDTFTIPENAMKQIFDPVVDTIVKAVDKFLDTNFKYLVMVGGFSTSPYLESVIRDRYKGSGTIKDVIKPPNPGAAVMMGAVMYAMDPSIITGRFARKTYGVQMCREFDPNKQYSSRATFVERGDKKWEDGVFDKYVGIGEEVQFDQAVIRTYTPLSPHQSSMAIKIFITDNPNPDYTEGEPEAEVEIPLPGTGMDRNVECSFFFGKTDIEIKVTNDDGDTKQIPMMFLSSKSK